MLDIAKLTGRLHVCLCIVLSLMVKLYGLFLLILWLYEKAKRGCCHNAEVLARLSRNRYATHPVRLCHVTYIFAGFSKEVLETDMHENWQAERM